MWSASGRPSNAGPLGGIARTMYSIALSVFLLAAAAFCAFNLIKGLRTGRTWLRSFPHIDRGASPWSYWVAIAFWIIFTAGFLAAFIGELLGLGLVARH